MIESLEISVQRLSHGMNVGASSTSTSHYSDSGKYICLVFIGILFFSINLSHTRGLELHVLIDRIPMK